MRSAQDSSQAPQLQGDQLYGNGPSSIGNMGHGGKNRGAGARECVFFLLSI
jgi:hypothetical protein